MPKKHTHPTIVVGTDHAGYVLKEIIKEYLLSLDYPVIDKGTFSGATIVDYPAFIFPVARAVARSAGKKFGVVFGGSGIGECIAANKVRGVRAALAYDPYTARMSREHNDANVLCLGGRTVTKDPEYAKRLVRIWLETACSKNPRYRRRIKQVAQYETRTQR
ncbi:RpiB/LacA/LacB family sugar-phosphate isomerase [Candidatus Uhrbacteria bacterium]|nr:RpiB/LacA/LacB family sugar-phosphate isomerase [Candidatus Uhrbacteria bacterium]